MISYTLAGSHILVASLYAVTLWLTPTGNGLWSEKEAADYWFNIVFFGLIWSASMASYNMMLGSIKDTDNFITVAKAINIHTSQIGSCLGEASFLFPLVVGLTCLTQSPQYRAVFCYCWIVHKMFILSQIAYRVGLSQFSTFVNQSGKTADAEKRAGLLWSCYADLVFAATIIWVTTNKESFVLNGSDDDRVVPAFSNYPRGQVAGGLAIFYAIVSIYMNSVELSKKIASVVVQSCMAVANLTFDTQHYSDMQKRTFVNYGYVSRSGASLRAIILAGEVCFSAFVKGCFIIHQNTKSQNKAESKKKEASRKECDNLIQEYNYVHWCGAILELSIIALVIGGRISPALQGLALTSEYRECLSNVIAHIYFKGTRNASIESQIKRNCTRVLSPCMISLIPYELYTMFERKSNQAGQDPTKLQFNSNENSRIQMFDRYFDRAPDSTFFSQTFFSKVIVSLSNRDATKACLSIFPTSVGKCLPVAMNNIHLVPGRNANLVFPPGTVRREEFTSFDDSDDYHCCLLWWTGVVWTPPSEQQKDDFNKMLVSTDHNRLRELGEFDEKSAPTLDVRLEVRDYVAPVRHDVDFVQGIYCAVKPKRLNEFLQSVGFQDVAHNSTNYNIDNEKVLFTHQLSSQNIVTVGVPPAAPTSTASTKTTSNNATAGQGGATVVTGAGSSTVP